ncbi:MAG: hypothetical protein QME83_16765 [Thermodesulfobacteriota bacterium]|nr:hypothetical protein [Thermodesulfobacteriota bacterium]
MKNLLLEKVEYKIETTSFGIWKRFAYPNGKYFAEFRSHATFWGLPFLHYTRGICPETGRRVVAKGIVAVGRLAMGVLAIGQASFGLIAMGQAGLGLLFGLGQGATGLYAIGQIAIGVWLGAGQVATGEIAIGQVAFGKYVLAQLGFGEHVWSMDRADPEAVAFFKAFLARFTP